MENTKETMVNRAQKEYEQLVDNSMGILPYAVVYEFSSERVEETIMRWLESKGIDTSSIVVRCVLKNRITNNAKIVRASHRTQLPFVVLLFKSLSENDDYTVEGGVNKNVLRNIARTLHNFKDSSQFRLKTETPLNKVLSILNGDNLDWELDKRSNRAFICLDSDSVVGLCFKKNPQEFSNYVVDFITKARTRTNMRTNYEEFTICVAISRNRAKKKPAVDPIKFLR